MQEIISIKNAKVKYWFQLYHKSALRKKQGEFVIEGIKEVEMALKNNYAIDFVLYFPDLIDENLIKKWKDKYSSDFELIKISKEIFEKLAYRKTTGGILAIARTKTHKINDVKLSENPLVIVAEGIEKPGNLGAILRTVDGIGADAFILVNSVVDLYNPNVIRSSLGTIFSNQIAISDFKTIKKFLLQNRIKLFAATLQNSHPYYLEDFTQASAIAVGSEAKGLTQEFREIEHQAIYIPMEGQADSLNVSVSAAVLGYEALRQRKILK